MEQLIEQTRARNIPCVIEGERNPFEFAKLYDPVNDMVVFLTRQDVDVYDTAIERGIAVIEHMMRWNVSTGITPQDAAIKITFGLQEIKGEYFGVANGPDKTFIHGPVKEKKANGSVEDRYPWINILIGCVREKITDRYNLIQNESTVQVVPAP